MKSVQEFFSESNRREVKPTPKGRSAAIDALSRIFNSPSAGRSELTSKEIIDAARTKGGSAAAPRSAPEAGVWLGSDDQAIRDAREALKKQAQRRVSKSSAAASDVSPEARTQAANTAARAKETRPQQRRKLGDTTRGGPVKVTTLKPSKPAPVPKPETVKPIKQAKVSKVAKGYTELNRRQQLTRSGDWTRARMSRAYGKNLATTGDSIIDALRKEGEKERLTKKTDLKIQTKSTKPSALGFPVTTDLTKGTKSGQLSPGTRSGKLADTTIKPVKVADVTKPPSTTKPAQLPAGTTKTTKTTTQPGRAPSTYRGTGVGRVEVSAPTKPKTQVLSPGQKTPSKGPEVKVSRSYTPPKVDKGPSISVTEPKPAKKVSYKEFTKQAGTTKTRKGAWSYSPSATKSQAQSQALQNVKRTLKQTNPAKYNRLLQKRALNIAKIRSTKNTSGGMLGAGLAGFEAMQVYKDARSSGQTKDYATKKAIATGAGGWAGAELGAKMGAKIGSKLPGRLGLIGAGVGAIGGGLVGGVVGTQGAKALVGASAKDKQAMAKMNRAIQRGVSTDQAQFKSGNQAIIRDASGKERVGYKAYKGGKEVYKHAADPAALRMTSSNPLERLGRSIAANKDLGPVSDWMKSRYAASDEAARKKKIATVKSA